MTSPTLSVVVLTKDGASTLPALLDGLSRQEISLPTELVVVDSGSTDGTLEIARARADRVITTPAERFNHGLTRNLGIEASRGDLVVLIVQDAVPADQKLLSHLAAPLRADPHVAGSFARQRPRSDASILTQHYLARWIAASDTGRTVQLDRAQLERLSPTERLERCAFDNVCSCIRRSAWKASPFRETPIAEDLAWAKDVLLAGHRLVFAPDAVVVHSHDRGSGYELSRTRTLHRQLFELFELRTIPSFGALARAVMSSLSLHATLERSNSDDLVRALTLAVAWPLGQYLGGRDGARVRRRREATASQ